MLKFFDKEVCLLMLCLRLYGFGMFDLIDTCLSVVPTKFYKVFV